MDVGLDQTVPIADSYGHHGVDCDPMSRQVAGIRERKNMYTLVHLERV